MPTGAFSSPKTVPQNYVSPSLCPQGLFRPPKTVPKNYVSPSICPQGLFSTQKTSLKIMYLQAYARRGFVCTQNSTFYFLRLCISKQVPTGLDKDVGIFLDLLDNLLISDFSLGDEEKSRGACLYNMGMADRFALSGRPGDTTDEQKSQELFVVCLIGARIAKIKS